MMSRGFFDEVVRLHARGDLTAHHPAMRAVGYRQLWSHVTGEVSLPDAVRHGIAATRQLAKRQLTWIRSEPDCRPLDPRARGAFEGWCRNVHAALSRVGR